MHASDFMTRDVIIVPGDLTIAAAAEIMEYHRIRHLPVVEEGVLLGILSDRDLRHHTRPVPGGTSAVPLIPIAAAMTPAPRTCHPVTHVADVVRIMTAHKIDCLPVVDLDDHLAGLITSTDLILLLIQLGAARSAAPEWPGALPALLQ